MSFDSINDTNFLLMSRNGTLIAQFVIPHSDNWRTFDKWGVAPYRKYFDTFEDALDDLMLIDANLEIEEDED